MFNKKLLTALSIIAGAASSQAHVVAPGEIPSMFSAEGAAAPENELTYTVHLH